MQVKGKWRGSKLLRHAVQYAVLLGAWYVGLSRVVDHMHHWSDVAVGFLVGALYGVLVVSVAGCKGSTSSVLGCGDDITRTVITGAISFLSFALNRVLMVTVTVRLLCCGVG